MTQLVATIFNATFQDGPERTTGFIVPDTGNSLAIHERWKDHWHVTHVPSGRAVMPPEKAKLTTRAQAIGFARRFYVEAEKLGADLKASDFEIIRRQMWTDRGLGEREAFWSRVI
jgi:hypothetical protein